MKFDDLINGHTGWLAAEGPESDIVLSSRVRLARNLNKHKFPNRTTVDEKMKILEETGKAIKKLPGFEGALLLKMWELNHVDKQFLSERYLISRELAQKGEGSAVIVNEDQVLSIMINEEDHLRIQVLMSGLRLKECWGVISKVDDKLSADLEYAFSPRLGYLTACPTNVGTGVRVSSMLHLPALILIKQIDQVLQAIIKLGLAVRGLYGEGTDVFGNLFQISNQITLGKTEEEIINSLEKVINQVVKSENDARKALLKSNSEVMYDKVGRAYGILQNAHVITSRETIDLLSTLRMGVDLSLISGIDRNAINELFILTQPAHLQKITGRELDAVARDSERGKLLRSKLCQN